MSAWLRFCATQLVHRFPTHSCRREIEKYAGVDYPSLEKDDSLMPGWSNVQRFRFHLPLSNYVPNVNLVARDLQQGLSASLEDSNRPYGSVTSSHLFVSSFGIRGVVAVHAPIDWDSFDIPNFVENEQNIENSVSAWSTLVLNQCRYQPLMPVMSTSPLDDHRAPWTAALLYILQKHYLLENEYIPGFLSSLFAIRCAMDEPVSAGWPGICKVESEVSWNADWQHTFPVAVHPRFLPFILTPELFANKLLFLKSSVHNQSTLLALMKQFSNVSVLPWYNFLCNASTNPYVEWSCLDSFESVVYRDLIAMQKQWPIAKEPDIESLALVLYLNDPTKTVLQPFHYAISVNVSHTDSWKNLAECLELLPRRLPVYVFCHDGVSSMLLGMAARAAGFERVSVLQGGLQHYSVTLQDQFIAKRERDQMRNHST